MDEDDGTVVWTLETETVTDAELAAFRATLAPDEVATAERMRDARTFVCAHGLVRRRLSDEHPSVDPRAWTFARREAGKPYVTGPIFGPELNLSHTDGLVACAFSRTPVGIDVEALARGEEILETVLRAFAPVEIAALQALPTQQHARRAVELWIVKEAYLKALGTGISRHLDRFSVGPDTDPFWKIDEDPRWRVTVRQHQSRWLVALAHVR